MKMFVLIFNTPLCEAQQSLPSSPIYSVDQKNLQFHESPCNGFEFILAF